MSDAAPIPLRTMPSALASSSRAAGPAATSTPRSRSPTPSARSRRTPPIAFAGTRDRMEWEAVPKAGYPIHAVTAVGFPAIALAEAARLPVQDRQRARRIARTLVGGFDPDVVVGTGGYVTGPVGLAATLQRRAARDPGAERLRRRDEQTAREARRARLHRLRGGARLLPRRQERAHGQPRPRRPRHAADAAAAPALTSRSPTASACSSRWAARSAPGRSTTPSARTSTRSSPTNPSWSSGRRAAATSTHSNGRCPRTRASACSSTSTGWTTPTPPPTSPSAAPGPSRAASSP